MIFISSPYSSTDKMLVSYRYQQVCWFCAQMLRNGHFVFSPIIHGHAIIEQDANLPSDWDFWAKYCQDTIARAEEVWVLMLDGWLDSKGVQAEIETAKRLKKTIKYFDCNGKLITN